MEAARPVDRTRLTLSDLGTNVVTNVRHRGLYRLKVAQPLPFLSLNTGVLDEEGRSAHIEAVSLSMEGGTPSLLLDLVYDLGVKKPQRAGERDDDSDGEPVCVMAPRRERRDETQEYAFERPSEAEIVVGDESQTGFWARLGAALLRLIPRLG